MSGRGPERPRSTSSATSGAHGKTRLIARLPRHAQPFDSSVSAQPQLVQAVASALLHECDSDVDCQVVVGAKSVKPTTPGVR